MRGDLIVAMPLLDSVKRKLEEQKICMFKMMCLSIETSHILIEEIEGQILKKVSNSKKLL